MRYIPHIKRRRKLEVCVGGGEGGEEPRRSPGLPASRLLLYKPRAGPRPEASLPIGLRFLSKHETPFRGQDQLVTSHRISLPGESVDISLFSFSVCLGSVFLLVPLPGHAAINKHDGPRPGWTCLSVKPPWFPCGVVPGLVLSRRFPPD